MGGTRPEYRETEGEGLLACWEARPPNTTEAIVSEYASEAAGAIHRLADIGEMIADGLFAIAAGMHTDDAASQRNMAAVFCDDARTRYKDVLRKVNKRQRDDMARFIDDICKGKAK